MAVVGSGVIPRKATLEVPVLPRIAAAVANPLAGRGTQYRSRRTTPRSHHRIPAPGPFARGDAANRARAGRYIAVERAPCGARTEGSSDMQAWLATPGRRWRSPQANAVARAGDSARLHPWRTRSLTLYQSSSATTLESFAPSGLRIVRAIQVVPPGAARLLSAWRSASPPRPSPGAERSSAVGRR